MLEGSPQTDWYLNQVGEEWIVTLVVLNAMSTG